LLALFVVDTDKRHKGEVVSALSWLSARESAAESIDHLSVSDDDNCSQQSSLQCAESDANTDSSCARTCYVLPVERWSGKRKRCGETAPFKQMKPSKPTWVDGLGRDGDESQHSVSENQSHVDSVPAAPASQVGTPSPTKSSTSSSTASSPMKLADKRVPATKAQPPPLPPAGSQLSPLSQSTSNKRLSSELDIGIKTHLPDGAAGKRTVASVTDGVRTRLTSTESPTRTRSSVTEAGTRTHPSAAVKKSTPSSSAMSPTSAAVSSIVGMSPPATPVMPETHATPSQRHSKQKGRSQRDPNSLPCKGNTTELSLRGF